MNELTDTELKSLIKQSETLVLNDESRKKLGGDYIKTPMGTTHYELKGEGEAIVLVHGYASPFCIYDKVYYKLVELGYKVLRYDLFGRGFSDRLPEKNSVDFFAKQLKEVTDALLGDESFILMGTSMGGAISATYIKNNPGRVKKLVCLAPAGMDSLKPPFYMYLSSCPVVDDILFKIMGAKILIKATQRELYFCPQEEQDEFTRKVAKACSYKGFLRSTISSLRNTIMKTKKSTLGYKAVAEQNIPVLLIWGTIDRTMPYYQHERFLEVCPQTEFVSFEGSGHNFLYDQGDKTFETIKDYLQR